MLSPPPQPDEAEQGHAGQGGRLGNDGEELVTGNVLEVDAGRTTQVVAAADTAEHLVRQEVAAAAVDVGDDVDRAGRVAEDRQRDA